MYFIFTSVWTIGPKSFYYSMILIQIELHISNFSNHFFFDNLHLILIGDSRHFPLHRVQHCIQKYFQVLFSFDPIIFQN